MYFMKHGELRKQSHNVEMISAQNVDRITYGCCASIVVVSEIGSSTLDVLKTISSSNVVWVSNFCCSVLKLSSYKSLINSTFHFFIA